MNLGLHINSLYNYYIKYLKIDTYFIQKLLGVISAQYPGLLWPDTRTKYVEFYVPPKSNFLRAFFTICMYKININAK